MSFIFPSPVTMVKSHGKKSGRNENFEEMDTQHLTEKNDEVWLLWEIFKEYIKQNIIMAVLTKANSCSFVIYRLIKNQ